MQEAYKVVREGFDANGPALVSAYVAGAALIAYPVGEWYAHPMPMFFFGNSVEAFRHVVGYEHEKYQVWRCQVDDVLPPDQVPSLRLHPEDAEHPKTLEVFWKYQGEVPQMRFGQYNLYPMWRYTVLARRVMLVERLG